MKRIAVVLVALAVGTWGCGSDDVANTQRTGRIEAGKVRITWFGQSMFLVQDTQTTVVADPYGPDVGYIVPRVKADIVLLSQGEEARPDVRVLGDPRIVDAVGEVFVGQFRIVGIPSSRAGRNRDGQKPNTIYYWRMQGISFVHMGSFAQRELTQQQQGLLRDVDILMMPVGGRTTDAARVAAAVTKVINPKAVIPMEYKTPAAVVDLAPVEVFSARFAAIQRLRTDTVEIDRQGLPSPTEVWVMRYKQQRP